MEKRKVLLVEDDLSASDALGFALEAKNYEVIHATNGRDALTMAREKQPHLIILDTMIPKMDGYQFCRLLKFDSRFNRIPVIIVSSKTQEADRELGLACGGNEYITKPYEIDNLLGIVERYLNSSS
ncbi:MAG: response regulator transcription factor [Candidatus Brocadiales bacterium]